MSDQALKNAKARLLALEADIAERETQLENLRIEKARAEKFIADWNDFAALDEVKPSNALLFEELASLRNPSKEIVGEHAGYIIERAQRPVARSDLMRELVEAGIRLYGKNPLMVLSTMMWRMQDRFVRIPKFGYWFRDRPFAPANYNPGDIPDTRNAGGLSADFSDANDDDDQSS